MEKGKTPTYIGIFAQDYKLASKTIRNYTKECLAEAAEKYSDNEQIMNDLASFEQTFQEPKDNFHITSLFIGGNSKKLQGSQSKQLKDFKDKEEVEIKIDFLVYVPGYLICGYCSETGGVEVENKFPHVTLYLANGAKAVESNKVIEAVYEADKEIFSKEFKKQASMSQKQIKFGTSEHLYILPKELKLPGVTGSNFVFGFKK